MEGTFQKGKFYGFIIGIVVFLGMLAYGTPEGMKPAAWSVACVTGLMACWWMTDAIPIPATSLLPIALFPLMGVMSAKNVCSSYGDDILYLFMGGFFLAVTMERWNLQRRVALHTIRFVGASPDKIVLGFMVATWFMSMWVSNTACAMMMVPIGLAVVAEVTGLTPSDIKAGKTTNESDLNFGRSLMLGIAFAASIGGLGTIIGTPPNAVLVGIVKSLYNYEISFLQWMMIGVPLSTVTLAISWLILCKFLFKTTEFSRGSAMHIIDDEIVKLGPWTKPEKYVLTVGACMALAWILGGFIFEHIPFLKNVKDSTIAIVGGIALFMMPVDRKKDVFLLDWNTAVKIPWDVIVLLGGGFAVAKGFQVTGLTAYVADQFTLLKGLPNYWFMTAIVIATIALTEVTSNTATATLLVPVMGTVAMAIGVNPLGPMTAAAIAASYAFMLPVATPPNAVAYGSGCFTIVDMARAGMWINVFCFVLVPATLYFLIPLFWGENLTVVPDWAIKAVTK